MKAWPASLAGRRIHVHAEQGIGDHIFFLRFAPIVAARGATLTVEAERRIEPMVARSGLVPVDAIPDGAEPTRMGDLPWLLGCRDDDVPAPLALPVLPDRAGRVAARLADLPRPILGVTWRAGGVLGRRDTTKRVPPEALAAVLRSARGTVVSVQRRPEADEYAAFAGALGREPVDLSGWNEDLESMLALMAALDGYVGVSNANVHLRCGAGLGSDILVPFPMDWRWRTTASGEVPWYPNSRAYHQAPDGDWSAALAALESRVRERWG
jgi:hypothetical protein